MITSQVQYQIAKFKFRQYQKYNLFFFAISPNLMPTKFSRYTVYDSKQSVYVYTSRLMASATTKLMHSNNSVLTSTNCCKQID